MKAAVESADPSAGRARPSLGRLINGSLLMEPSFPGTVYGADGTRPGSVARLPALSSALVSCTCH